MQPLEDKVSQLMAQVSAATKQLSLEKLTAEIQTLTRKSQAADFWHDSELAQATMKRLATLQTRTAPWVDLQQGIMELQELLATHDRSLEKELSRQLTELSTKFDHLKDELKLAGPYDDHSVVMSIYAGAGGTDAQDWAQILYRMYARWAEAHHMKCELVEQSVGEEAGIKSITFTVDGAFAYGKLKGEHGVHRLVRLSPFNADNLRQTSFAKVEVMPRVDQPDEIAIDDKDLKIDVYRSGGHGGQSVNTTDSAVRITHLPTGIVVAIQNERSQLQNKETALTILRSKLAQLQLEQHAQNIRELKGPNEAAAWGNQIRNYVLHPYKQVKDLRTHYETSDVDAVLDGQLDQLIDAYLEHTLGQA